MGRRLLIGAALLVACAQPIRNYEWVEAFGYADRAVFGLEVRTFGFPWVPVEFGADTVWLPFDTGNMAGLTLESEVFQRLGLPCTEKWDRLDSGGRVISTGCTAQGVEATVFGTTWESVPVLEFFHPSLPGLVGPEHLPGTRFTIDYRSGLIASDSSTVPDSIPGFETLPLVRSGDHPLLILAYGRVQGEEVLVEIDTGKSRTTVDRSLVEALGMEETSRGARVGRVEFGSRSWEITSARVVDTSGISEGLPARISLGLGSDLLEDFVFTVDYPSRRIWLELAPASEPPLP